MATAVPLASSSSSSVAPRRFALALSMSVVAHVCLVRSFLPDSPQGAERRAGAGTLAVRLVPRADTEPAGRIIPIPEPPRVLHRDAARDSAAGGGEVAPANTGAGEKPRQGTTAPRALPRATDPTYYAAHELDAYPRPAVPIDLEGIRRRHGDNAVGRFRFSLLIDEAGIVKEITIVEYDLAGVMRDELRELLAATRFIPARKDGRAVKCRVLISLSLVAAG